MVSSPFTGSSASLYAPNHIPLDGQQGTPRGVNHAKSGPKSPPVAMPRPRPAHDPIKLPGGPGPAVCTAGGRARGNNRRPSGRRPVPLSKTIQSLNRHNPREGSTKQRRLSQRISCWTLPAVPFLFTAPSSLHGIAWPSGQAMRRTGARCRSSRPACRSARDAFDRALRRAPC